MGEHALKSHAKGLNHKREVDRIQKVEEGKIPVMVDYFTTFRKSTSSHASTEPSSLANSPTTSSSKKPLLATGDSVLTAEVLHCLNLVEKHHSFNSSNSSSDLYKKMFPDSAIASGFSCSERKAAYMSTFGISPYLAELQRKAVLSEKDYVLLFDETLNGPLQSKQLDVHTDSPMMPFIAEDLFTTIKSLLRRILQAETLSKLKSPRDLIALDLKSKDIFLAYSKIEIGIASSKVLQKTKATDLQIMTLKNECRQFISSLVAKLLDKSPVMIRLVQKLSCLNPSLMASSPQLAASRFRDLLIILGDSGRISLNECDQIYNKFVKCLEALEDNNLKPKFELFHPATERLDDFLYNNFKPLDTALWDVLRPLLLLSHGQATVERGFSYNKEVMIENMHEETLIAQRRICDFLKVNGGVLDVAITKPLLTAAASGRQNYNQYLEKQKTKKAEMAKSLKRKRHDDELSDLKAKRKKLMEEEKFLRSSADKYADEAEAKQNFKLLSKSNDMRHEAKVKSAELVVLERTIQSKLQELLDC
ncbi:oxysterol-binding -related 5 isoform X1 [Biomphalaria glabrata]